MPSISWFILSSFAILTAAFVAILPACTILLAVATILRAEWRRRSRGHDDDGDGGERNRGDAVTCGGPRLPWGRVDTAFFRGTVFHIRHQPAVHSFRYPLYFSVVDLDEAPGLFGRESVRPRPGRGVSPRGDLWPLSSLMMLRDTDHLKNGEGLAHAAGLGEGPRPLSLGERIANLVYERTDGGMDLRSTTNDGKDAGAPAPERRRILLVTHLMYYGYCFNPVSFYFVLKSNRKDENREEDRNNNDNCDEDGGEEVEAIVVEVSNTPWNEMSIYVLHPDSADVAEHGIDPPGPTGDGSSTHRYKWRKNFHVSPFMSMDHDYDWKFRVARDRIRVDMRMTRRGESPGGGDAADDADDGEGPLYFVAGFDIRRTVRPTWTYPLQLARVIIRFPIYCFVIQLWIHYEAVRLLIKGVEFIPHPEGSETGASRAIAAVMGPVFAAMDAADTWWGRWKSRGKGA